VLNWFAREKRTSGWFAASLDAEAFDFARGRRLDEGRCRIAAYGSRPVGLDKNGLQKLGHEMRLGRTQCATLLRPGDYQLLLVEAPNVPAAELKSAVRWRVKDMLDYPVDEATIDVLDIPPDASGAARARMMFAVCARNNVIMNCIKTFHDARIPLSVIDIRETAQRNLAALFEEQGRGLAVVYFAEDWGLLTINYGAELFLARRTDIGLNQLGLQDEDARIESLERVALELQRSFDHFDRQFHHVAVAKLLVAPTPRDIGLVPYLASNLTLAVESMDLHDRLIFEDGEPDAATQWRLFHHFGSTLRHEGKLP
jgi:MSHA biogenesis protein MshI